MKKYRVAKCEETKKDVLQIQEKDGVWLCLHNGDDTESLDLDQVAVDAFLAGSGGLREPYQTDECGCAVEYDENYLPIKVVCKKCKDDDDDTNFLRALKDLPHNV